MNALSLDHPENPWLTIRPETGADIPAIRRIHQKAFGQPDEGILVDRLRTRGAATLSLVAVLDSQVVGHILFSPVTITGPGHNTPAVGLGPVGVLPALQRQGIGTALINQGLAKLREQGHQIVIVLGHREYYPRFGFSPTRGHGIEWEHEVDPSNFMVLELQPGVLARVQGVVRYLPEFTEV